MEFNKDDLIENAKKMREDFLTGGYSRVMVYMNDINFGTSLTWDESNFYYYILYKANYDNMTIEDAVTEFMCNMLNGEIGKMG